MATNNYIRERLIRIVRAAENGVPRRDLLRSFNVKMRQQVNFQIGMLLGDHVFVSTGLKRKGAPETISASGNFPAERCPFCLRDLPHDTK